MSEASWVPPALDAPALAEVLSRHGVRYVIIGGFVTQLHVPGYVSEDVDFTPAKDHQDLVSLSSALRELGARTRADAEPEGLAFGHSAESLGKASMWNLQCKYGAFDISFEPSGGGYDHLAPRASLVTVRGVEMPIADLADVVESKQLANRVKDQRVLPELRAALERQHRSAPIREPQTPERPGPGPGEPGDDHG